jgi:uncharacterized delta-60 repeat protein
MPKLFDIDFSATTSVCSVIKTDILDLNNISYNDNNKSLLVGGRFLGYDKYYRSVVKVFSGGSVDDSFVVGNGILGLNQIVYITEIDNNNGSYFIGGSFSSYNNVPANNFVKVTNLGTIDSSFNYGSGFNSDVLSIKLQSDGKILVGGNFSSYNGVNCNRIVRLNIDGSIDNTFSIGTGFNGGVSDIKITNDNLIYVGGSFDTYQGLNYRGIVRIDLNGSIDTTFNTLNNFPTFSSVLRIIISDNNSVYLGGSFSSYSSTTANNMLKLTSGGTIDTSFNIGSGFNSTIIDMCLDSLGDIYAVGGFTTFTGSTNQYMIKLKPNGSKDTTFNNASRFSGNNFISPIRSVFVDSNGRIFIGGRFTTYSLNFVSNLITLDSVGNFDTSFNFWGSILGTSSLVYTIKQDINGNFIFGGSFITYKEPNSLVSLKEYDAKRSYDYNTNYGVNASVSVSFTQIRALLKSVSNNVFIGGYFENYNLLNGNYRAVAILGTDTGGTPNNLINVNTGANNVINNFYEDKNGGIFMIGLFNAYKGVAVPNLVKITTGATIDNTFVRTGLQSGNIYRTMDFDLSNNIYLGGSFTTFSSQTNNFIIKLLPTGFKDTSFDNSIGFNGAVNALVVDDFGKILVGGGFLTYKGTVCNRIVRLNTDGSIDNTFSFGVGLNGDVWTIKKWGNKFYVLGNFTTYNNVVVNRIMRLNYDGSLDMTFNPKSGILNTFFPVAAYDAMKVDQYGSVYIYSSSFAYQIYPSSFITKIKPDGSRDVLFNITDSNFGSSGGFPYVANLIQL